MGNDPNHVQVCIGTIAQATQPFHYSGQRYRKSHMVNQAKGRRAGGKMTNRNSLLGRSGPTDRLSKQEIQALDHAAAPAVPKAATAQPPQNKNIGKEAKVKRALLKFHWTMECPECGFKVAGSGQSPARVTTG